MYAAVRAAGGVCIADEVQVGYGRLGTHFWGFQEHDVSPDIVTMAKAAGNGFPLGFVVTTRELANAFVEGGASFFSSSGGSPCSAVAGLAVLDGVREQKLQDNARVVGAHIKARLESLRRAFPHIVGCIHGHGLYQGVELVRNATTREPATEEARAINDRLLELGIISHATGDYSNVLKVRVMSVWGVRCACGVCVGG